ncbi:MAG: hypothetical protein MUD16_10100 [Desulfobacterales bacterium]|jgi:hypothetical protein|nr:hypothetical protein [Desulfobacterales bacterium]
MDDNLKQGLQLAWGVLLVLAGVGLCFRIPQVMPQIRQIEQFSGATAFIYFSLYFVALFLVAGGARKLFIHYRKRNPPPR